MIQKVTLYLGEDGKFTPEKPCSEMNPKELLLYAAALCTGLTAQMILRKERIAPKRFEVSYSGELSTDQVQAESVFRSFHVVYNIECATEDDQAKVGHAATLTQEKYCGMSQMLRRIAEVTYEIAVVSTEPEKA